MTIRINGSEGISFNGAPYGGGNNQQGMLQSFWTSTGPTSIGGTGIVNPTAIGLDFTFTPLRADSLIVMWANLSVNQGYVHSFGWFRDGAKTVSTAGFTNTNEADMQQTVFYDGVTPSQINTQRVFHFETSGSTTTRVYDVYATSGWNGETTRNITINDRSNNDMSCFSTAMIMEIAQ